MARVMAVEQRLGASEQDATAAQTKLAELEQSRRALEGAAKVTLALTATSASTREAARCCAIFPGA